MYIYIYILRKTESLKIAVKNMMTVLTAKDFDMSPLYMIEVDWIKSLRL